MEIIFAFLHTTNDKGRNMEKNRLLGDSAALAVVRIFTMATSIVSTMILSRTLPLMEYGTYSAGNLIITTATLLSAFGLIDAVNYYYNGKDSKDRMAYINSVFAMFLFCGVGAAAIILCGSDLITAYFHNPALGVIYGYIAFRPLASNLGQGLQNLQVSIGKARLCAYRNAALSSIRVGAVLVAALTTKDIRIVFGALLAGEIVADYFYFQVLKDNGICLNFLQLDLAKLREIFAFCIPMGFYIQLNAFSRDLDKYVIGFYETTEQLAIYTNCSARLPFDVVSGPLVTLLVPLLTGCIRKEALIDGFQLFKCYIKIGYIFTFTFGIGSILVSAQAVQFLYGEQYLSGIPVFIVYIIVDMLNFISYSLVLAAKGKTVELMKVSIVALACNGVINVLMYKWLGFIGPALATVIVTFGVNGWLLYKSVHILQGTIASLIDKHHFRLYVIESMIVYGLAWLLRNFLEEMNIHYIVIFILAGGFYVGVMVLLNLNEAKKCFTLLNQINRKN